MARAPRPVPVVSARRPPSERRQLDPAFEALARGDTDRLRPPPMSPRLKDPRAHAPMPGVANRDARLVLDARIRAIQSAASAEPGDLPALERGLAEARLLELWRARLLTSFDAFAEHAVGLGADEALAAAQRGADALGVPLAKLRDEVIAQWVRIEAALLEANVPGRVQVRTGEAAVYLSVELASEHASAGFAAIGRKLGPLAMDQERRPPRAR